MIAGKQNETHQMAWPWLVLGIVLMILLTWFNSWPETVGLLHEPWDKVAHVLIFGGLTLIIGLSAGGRRRWAVLFFMMAFAAFDEVRQIFLPGREASMGDFASDMLAIIVVLLLALPLLLHWWSRRR